MNPNPRTLYHQRKQRNSRNKMNDGEEEVDGEKQQA